MNFKNSVMALLERLTFFLYGGIIFGYIGYTHRDITLKEILIFLSLVSASISLIFLALIHKKWRAKITYFFITIAISCTIVYTFSLPLHHIAPPKTQPQFNAYLYHGLKLEHDEISYLRKITNSISILNYNSQIFQIISLYPQIEKIPTEFIDNQIIINKNIIDKLSNTTPPKSFQKDHQIILGIAQTQLDNYQKIKRKDLFETVFTDQRIADNYHEKSNYLQYYLFEKTKEI